MSKGTVLSLPTTMETNHIMLYDKITDSIQFQHIFSIIFSIFGQRRL